MKTPFSPNQILTTFFALAFLTSSMQSFAATSFSPTLITTLSSGETIPASSFSFTIDSSLISENSVTNISSTWANVNNLDSGELGWVGHVGSSSFSNNVITFTPSDDYVFGNLIFKITLSDLDTSIQELESLGMTISFGASSEIGFLGFANPNALLPIQYSGNTIATGNNSIFIPGSTLINYFGTPQTQASGYANQNTAVLGFTIYDNTQNPITISNLELNLGSIPEPASLGLLLTAGMFTLINLRRRKH